MRDREELTHRVREQVSVLERLRNSLPNEINRTGV